MSNVTNATVSTKPAAGADSVKTELSINWEDCSPEDIRALAQQALIVKLQGKWRKQEGGIPAKEDIKVSDHKVGVRGPKVKKSLLDSVATMTAEEKAKLLEMLTA